ncbi:hypothetical protein ACFL6Y_07165 [Elusimicrobiota bacterium]
MATLFSKTLMGLRKEAGFKTAYQFYYNNGGKEVFKIAYRNYLKIERGVNFPLLQRLRLFITLLRIPPGSSHANELITAWFGTCLSEGDFKTLILPLISNKSGALGPLPMQETVRRVLTDKIHYITPEQMEVFMGSLENYWCHTVLQYDKRSWKAENLAKELHMKPAAIKKALKNLVKTGTVKETRKNVFKGTLAGKILQFPSHYPPQKSMALVERQKKYVKAISKRSVPVFIQTRILRADKMAFRNFLPYLSNNITAANAYAINEKTDNSAFYYVEGRVTRLFPF